MIRPSMGFLFVLVLSSTALGSFVLDEFNDSQEALCGTLACPIEESLLTLEPLGLRRLFGARSLLYETIRIDSNISSPSKLMAIGVEMEPTGIFGVVTARKA